MDKPIKVWFPEFALECHRTQEQSRQTVAALKEEGVICYGEDYESYHDARLCDIIFCGSWRRFVQTRDVRKQYPFIPTVYYCWDLYPFQFQIQDVTSPSQCTRAQWWQEYVDELSTCDSIIVPSRCTIDRVKQYAKQDAVVIKSIVYPWEVDDLDPPPTQSDYVMDVMRGYPGDPNINLVRDVCTELGIPFRVPGHTLSWDDFRRTVYGARLLISPFYEASTGGLTLLEGYYHGKPVLVSNSPRHGGIDYFGNRANYFQWDNKDEFIAKLCLNSSGLALAPSNREAKHWIHSEYSDQRFARQLATHFRKVLGQ